MPFGICIAFELLIDFTKSSVDHVVTCNIFFLVILTGLYFSYDSGNVTDKFGFVGIVISSRLFLKLLPGYEQKEQQKKNGQQFKDYYQRRLFMQHKPTVRQSA